MKWRTKVAAAVVAFGALMGLGVTPAHATFNYKIEYIADCPGLAEYQQLVIRPYPPGMHAHVYSYYDMVYNNGPGNTMEIPMLTQSGIWYNTVMYRDKMRYVMYVDTRNFYYHVSCYYY